MLGEVYLAAMIVRDMYRRAPEGDGEPQEISTSSNVVVV